jgi:hypothetical protein
MFSKLLDESYGVSAVKKERCGSGASTPFPPRMAPTGLPGPHAMRIRPSEMAS